MATFWNGQISHGEADFRIQFRTDDYSKYKQVEKLCQQLISANGTEKGVENYEYE